MLRNFLLVGLGGAAGSMLRFAAGLLIGSKNFPWSTLLINIIGSLIIGIIMAYSARNEIFSANWKLFLATGICGGFTTFSAFSYENLQLIQEGKLHLFVGYLLSSIIFGMAAVWIGYTIMERV